MTALCCVEGIYGTTAIIADALVSGSERESRLERTPLVDDLVSTFPAGSGYVPVELRQKIVQITPNCLIGWSGSQLHAARICKELKELFNNRLINDLELEEYLTRPDSELKTWLSEVGLVGLVADGRNLRIVRTTDVVEVEDFRTGRCFYTGSGGYRLYTDINESFKQFLPQILNENRPDSLGAWPELASLHGIIQRKEQTNRDVNLHYYGGAYEVGVAGVGVCGKLDGIRHLYHEAIIDLSGNAEVRLDRISDQHYENEALIFVDYRCRNRTLEYEVDRRFVIPPLLAEEKSGAIRPPTFGAQTHVVSVFLKEHELRHIATILKFESDSSSDKFAAVRDLHERLVVTPNDEAVIKALRPVYERTIRARSLSEIKKR